jgi:DHA1 family tetracycline resistance protein-like MFS transporter
MRKAPTLAIVFAIVLVDMLGVGILIPVIPLLLTDPSYPYYLGLSRATGYITLGFLIAIFPFMQFIATPILGQLSDRMGRKPVLAFSIAGTSLSYVIFAIGIITKNIPLLFASRALDGITGGNIAVAQAAIADSTAPKDRAKSFGIIGAAFGIGFIIGPFLGGLLSDPKVLPWFNATTPFWLAAVLAFLNMLLVLFLFKETLKKKVQGNFHILQSLINIKKAALNEKLRPLFISSFFFQGGFSFYTTFFGVFLIHRFQFGQSGIGNYFALIGLCVALTQAVVTGFMAKRFRPYTIVLTSFLGASITIFSLYLVQTTTLLYLITIPNAIFIGLIMANLTGLVSRSAGDHEQGEVLGISNSVQALAQSIPPVIGGFIAATIAPSTPILVASLIIMFAAITFGFSVKRTAGTH